MSSLERFLKYNSDMVLGSILGILFWVIVILIIRKIVRSIKSSYQKRKYGKNYKYRKTYKNIKYTKNHKLKKSIGGRFERDVFNDILLWSKEKNIKGYLLYQVKLDTFVEYPRIIDILFLHKTGLYIIECKNWRGQYYSMCDWNVVFGIKIDELHNT